MKKLNMGEVKTYRGCFIMPIDGGFDVVDKRSGRWTHWPTQRAARWNASVWTRLSDAFESSSPIAQASVVKMYAAADQNERKAK